MTTTQTESFTFTRAGESYSGSPLWDVTTPAGELLGSIAKSDGTRGTTWRAILPGGRRSQGGFRDREAAARFLEERAR